MFDGHGFNLPNDLYAVDLPSSETAGAEESRFQEREPLRQKNHPYLLSLPAKLRIKPDERKKRRENRKRVQLSG